MLSYITSPQRFKTKLLYKQDYKGTSKLLKDCDKRMRVVNQRRTPEFMFTNHDINIFYNNEYIWCPISDFIHVKEISDTNVFYGVITASPT